MHIAIAGNIGAGKTSLTELLHKHYGWEALYEDVVENPYLDDFYAEMERWSFNQIGKKKPSRNGMVLIYTKTLRLLFHRTTKTRFKFINTSCGIHELSDSSEKWM